MTNAILITGNTYPHRRELRSAGAIFDYDEKGYVAGSDNEAVKKAAEAAGLDIEDYEASEEQLSPATGERLRDLRQDKIDRKRARLYAQAEAAERRGDKASNRISDGERSFLSLGEPIKIGHHSEGRHRKLIERVQKSSRDAAMEYKKAEELRRKADYMLDAVVKGDAERGRQKEIEHAEDTISVGDLIKCFRVAGNEAIVVKSNKKTFTVRSVASGDQSPVPKHFCTLIERRDPVKVERRFKKGDRVIYERGASTYEATVVRRTPNGYKVEFMCRMWGGEEKIQTNGAMESDLTLMKSEDT